MTPPRLVPGRLLLLLGPLVAGCPAGSEAPEAPPREVRVATFNVRELTLEKLSEVDADGAGRHPQLLAAAEIVRRVRPDVLVLQEIDHPRQEAGTPGGDLAAPGRRFVDAYLARVEEPLDYPHAWAAPTNTGLLSGIDLDGDGVVATPAHRGAPAHGGDSYGWGVYPGQYSMVVLSRLPLAGDEARTFQRFPWRDLPGDHLPRDHYSPEQVAALRLSSKSHWDLPVMLPGGGRLHLLVSHPTPPSFDGPEDRNGRRNFDEILFWAGYLSDEPWPVDDRGRAGGYGSDDPFVVIGDLNADPAIGDAVYDGRRAAALLLDHPRLGDAGALQTSRGALRGRPAGPPRHFERATAEFLDGVRVDYVLPGRELEATGGGVFWPHPAEDPEGARLAEEASDHRLVWLDVAWPPGGAAPAP